MCGTTAYDAVVFDAPMAVYDATSNARSWGRVELVGESKAMACIPYGHVPS